MTEFLKHYENFAFRALTFQTRATPLEYWAVVPLIWILILWCLIGDIAEVGLFLIKREIPPLNPLYYESVMIFVLTLVPRMAVNIRRFHDLGKTGFWILLPIIAMISGLLLLSGLVGAMMNSSLTGISDGPDELSNVFYPMGLYLAAPDRFWDEMYQIAHAFHKIGWDAVWGLLAEIYAHSGKVDIRREVADVSTGIEGNTGHTIGFVFVAFALVTTPFVTTILHLAMNALPSSPKDNLYGPAKVVDLQYRTKEDDIPSAMDGYKYLFEETSEEKARKKEANLREVKSLYRERILGMKSDS